MSGLLDKLEGVGIIVGAVLFCSIAFWRKNTEPTSYQGGKRKTKRKLLQ